MEVEKIERELKDTIDNYCNKIGCNRCPYRRDDGNCRACQLDEKIRRIEYEQMQKEGLL